jgi:hypothetical protein
MNGTIEPPRRIAPRAAHPSWRRFWMWMIPALVAAAAVFVIINRPATLRMIAVTGSGRPVIDGKIAPGPGEEAIGRRIRPGMHLQMPDSLSVDLLARDVVMIEVTPGTRVTVPQAPDRLFNRASACSLLAGEIRVKTGSRFHGVSLRVYTPDGVAVITGTLLSVQTDRNGTCVCVQEGTAHVGVTERDLRAVQPGYREAIARGGTPAILPIAPPHRDGLLDFERRLGDRIRPRR